MLPEIYYTAGVVCAICEVLHRGIVSSLLSGSAQKVKRRRTPVPLQKLLQGMQLSSGPHAACLPDSTVLLGMLQGDRDAIVTFVELLFAVAIRRASKCAAWATSYAQLCAQLRAAGEPSGQHRAVESAVQGRATAEYCKLSVRTVSITPQGTPKSTGQQSFGIHELLQRLQMDSDMEELQGSMRFMGSLFREHLLPYALVHTLNLAKVHAQPLVALALVSLLRMCTDAYVSAELEAHGQAAGQHARHLSTVLMRLRASVDTSAELSSDVQDLQFKLCAYASSICPILQQHSAPRPSGDLPGPEHTPSGDLSHVMWPGMRQRGF